ncbi:RDD family protein [Mycolicibacterium arenosum]|uniref:RDD family protein n=1 Tax=Mycolicibacterium arenosum TaxID=2952157 RepID=UPI0038CD0ED5
MTVVIDADKPDVDVEEVRTAPLASWGRRLGAISLDYLPGLAVFATLTLVGITAPLRGWLWWTIWVAAGLVVFAVLANRVVLPTVLGFSLGRAVAGIRVLQADGDRPGVVRLFVRELAHLLDTAAVFVGWLWPLWDRRRRTFADLLARTEVQVVEEPKRNVRKLAAWVLIAATLLSAAGAGLGYAVVYRQERAVEQARAQIAEQGPRIVEQMLSYGADTVQADFARAQNLATDAYRQQIIDQQQAVQKSGVTANEYWSVSSAVLSVDTTRAAMLLALQGQRGANPDDLKFITATVRVDFERSGDSWRVSNLQVLKRPLLPPPAPPQSQPPQGGAPQ